ncbi:MAG: hypothetical protein HQK99_13250 [Nitrospirae bacterium]|nr:hypothetical protein [Nitrospirota bacterium]
MRNYNMNNRAYSDESAGKETPNTVYGAQRVYTPREMTEYVQFRINGFNEKARKLYDLLVTEKSIRDFKEEAAAITLVFMDKVRDIVDVSSIQWAFDDIKSKPTELKEEVLSFYKGITGSLKRTYYSLLWLYISYPNTVIKSEPGNGDSAANMTRGEGYAATEGQ